MKIKYFSAVIIGPNPSQGRIGGVVRHVSTLMSLNLGGDVQVYDPGSYDSRNFFQIIATIYRSLFAGFRVEKFKARNVIVNTSIYSGSILKLFLILIGFRRKGSCAIRVFFHGGDFEKIYFLKYMSIRFVLNIIMNKVDTFYFLSSPQIDHFRKLFPSLKSEMYSNYLAENEVLPHLACERKIFLFVGRLVKDKGVFEILKVIREIYESCTCLEKISFWFVGDGPEYDSIRKAEAELPAGLVKCLGALNTNDLNEIYRSSHALLLPSYGEGFPYVVIEALRAGLPIICTPCGALPDLIAPMENGLFVPIGDVDELGNAIKLLATDDDLVEKMRKNNYKLFIDRLSKSAAEKYYSSLLVS